MVMFPPVPPVVGAPPEALLPYLLEAYELGHTSKLHNMTLAETYFKMAFRAEGETRTELARKSLKFFEQYAQGAIKDADERRNVARMLGQNYASRFPELADEIEALRGRLGL